MRRAQLSLNWTAIDLVVFDLDGTLYDQTKLRVIMLAQLLLDAARSGSLDTLRILRAFRKIRELLAENDAVDFAVSQYEQTAFACACSPAMVKATVNEWIEHRPLAYLPLCRFAGIVELFDGLKSAGKTIGILSDYPADNKLSALSLSADIVVSATDDDVQRLKPNPRGLNKILGQTNVPARRTLMIGDRYEKDWQVAQRVGAQAAILSRHEYARCTTFRSYRDELFSSLTGRPSDQARGNNAMAEL